MSFLHIPIVTLCLLGLVISAYAYSVEQRAEESKRMGTHYRAMCDIGPFSCTRIFSSEFGSVTQLVGLPKMSNALVGMLFYLVQVILAWSPTLTLCLSAASVVASCALAYILFFVLHDVCIVCCSIYVVNISTAYLAYRWWRRRGTRGRGGRSSRADATAGVDALSHRRRRAAKEQ